MEHLVIVFLLFAAIDLFIVDLVPTVAKCLWYVIKPFAIGLGIILKFAGKGLLWIVIRASKGTSRACVLAGRGSHFSVLLLYFLIDEKCRGARQEEFDESEREQPEDPAETAPSETAYQAALATLGLEPGVTRDVLNKAYKKMMVKVHPDMPGGSTRAAQALNTSRDLVMDWNGWT